MYSGELPTNCKKTCPWCGKYPTKSRHWEYDKMYLTLGCTNNGCPTDELWFTRYVRGGSEEVFLELEKEMEKKWDSHTGNRTVRGNEGGFDFKKDTADGNSN